MDTPSTEEVFFNEQHQLDGLISQENSDLRDRVADLEKKVASQVDEIACLKSAMADTLRRLHNLEHSKGNRRAPSVPISPVTPSGDVAQFSGLSSPTTKPTASGTPRRGGSTSNLSARPRTAGGESSGGAAATSNSNAPIRKSTAGTVNASRTKSARGAGSNSSAQDGNVKEAVYLKDDGIVRMYLRGRAISCYTPNCLEDYNVKAAGELPPEKLKLEWVYGYRGRDCRNNVHFLPTGEVVYFVAAVVILYNMEEQMQRHYLGHNDDVKCIAVHPDRITIATGQVAGHDKHQGKPHIRIWNSVNLNTLHVLGLGEFERAVCCLAFSRADGGDLLCAVDEANEHIISVWEWQKAHKITETKSSMDPVLAAEFHPLDSNSIVTCGKGHLAFWTLDGVTLSKKQGIFDKHEKPKFVLCLTFAENGDLITGDSSGNIFVWKKGGNRITQAITGAHDGGIFSVCLNKDGNLLSGGGKDRKIILWDSSLNGPSGQEALLDAKFGPVRTISQGPGGVLLIGTTKNCILQGSLGLEFSAIVEGHTEDVWGLANHPTQHQFITAAYDKTLILWDTLTKQAVFSKELSDPAHSAAFYPSSDDKGSQLVAIGTQTGRWIVLNTTTREIVAVHTDGNEQIECLEYSPDGQYLALGSRDNSIYVYSALEGGTKYSRIGKCNGHSSFVQHIDWSEDSNYLRSTSGDYEILYWTANNCRQVASSGSLRDVQWKTQYCTLGFEVLGIWPEGADGTDINASAKASQKKILATADDFGKVNLFKYPVTQPKAPSHSYGGHSSHVTNVRFLYDDSRLLTTGGHDTAVMQWEVV